jgi:uncharacterized protein YycO
MGLRVIYCRRWSLDSLAIRAAAWGGPWSHCGIVVGDSVVESLALRGGVVVSPLAEVSGRSMAYEVVDIDCPDPQRGVEWALSTVGMPYDWGGVLAFPFRRRDWAADGRWYCSEHVERALIEAGRARFRDAVPGVSPSMSYYAR